MSSDIIVKKILLEKDAISFVLLIFWNRMLYSDFGMLAERFKNVSICLGWKHKAI
jgi:hypothetical protein